MTPDNPKKAIPHEREMSVKTAANDVDAAKNSVQSEAPVPTPFMVQDGDTEKSDWRQDPVTTEKGVLGNGLEFIDNTLGNIPSQLAASLGRTLSISTGPGRGAGFVTSKGSGSDREVDIGMGITDKPRTAMGPSTPATTPFPAPASQHNTGRLSRSDKTRRDIDSANHRSSCSSYSYCSDHPHPTTKKSASLASTSASLHQQYARSRPATPTAAAAETVETSRNQPHEDTASFTSHANTLAWLVVPTFHVFVPFTGLSDSSSGYRPADYSGLPTRTSKCPGHCSDYLQHAQVVFVGPKLGDVGECNREWRNRSRTVETGSSEASAFETFLGENLDSCAILVAQKVRSRRRLEGAAGAHSVVAEGEMKGIRRRREENLRRCAVSTSGR
ncbi:hypothetical protein FN846DRAFT_890386 [Sphaerosporella brunnea]|uniref:Uncharacterized protein n=1 Tax=Sphaerosporella brunnea TaxID=1250544 RepID=A0A5J5EXS7_9PEZI|nr:hypothetical protein FN846DRAFT_890386 [Sphaerosporella brunnea]